jgi:hydroxyethylthiazole kinase-like uncharacterized protein yjeF
MASLDTQIKTLDSFGLAKRLQRAPSEHKGNAGKALLIGGSPGMAGALLLAGNACLHLGAGWTLLEMLDPSSAQANPDQPELMIRLATNLAQESLEEIGPGLGQSDQALNWLKACITYPKIPLVIDADGLNLIGRSTQLLGSLQERNHHHPGQTVLTPHPGEAAALLKCPVTQIQDNRPEALKQLAQLTQSIIVLKGQHTLIAGPQHAPLQCNAGNPGMATGGMGDVLTGSITAIASQGIGHHLNLWESTLLAVQLHASAADSLVQKGIGPIGLTPTETILEMRSLLNRLL